MFFLFLGLVLLLHNSPTIRYIRMRQIDVTRTEFRERTGSRKQPSNRRDPWPRTGQNQEWRTRKVEPSMMGYGHSR